MEAKVLAAVVLALAISACSSKDDNSADTTAAAEVNTTTQVTEQLPESESAKPTEASPEVNPVAESIDQAALLADAQKAAQALGSTLRQELQQAMQAGGPVAAIDVCSEKAPAIAQAVSNEMNMQVTRVSLKNRNPAMGKPLDWQVAILEDFDRRKAAGEDPSTLAVSKIEEGEFRFMRALPTEAACLNCHGSAVQPEVMSKLQQLYPGDLAIGYSEGDLRGALVVVKRLAE